jgi:peroxiredoxin
MPTFQVNPTTIRKRETSMNRPIPRLFLCALLLAGSIACAGSQVAPSAEEAHPLAVGSTVPDATLSTMEGNPTSLHAAMAGKPTVIVFYRGDWCPYCNRQLSSLEETQKALQEMGFQIIAISPDTPDHLQATFDKNKLTYTLLSDSQMETAKSFGLAFQVAQEVIDKYLNQYNLDLSDYSGEDHGQLPVPAVYIVSGEGKVLFEHHDPDYTHRLKEEALLKAAENAKEDSKR